MADLQSQLFWELLLGQGYNHLRMSVALVGIVGSVAELKTGPS